MAGEFQELGHSGGKITLRIRTNKGGGKSLQMQWTHSRPVHAGLIELYALPQGIPLEPIASVGIGGTYQPPSVPGSFHIFVSTDSEGRYGHHCPVCEGYWRSSGWGHVCPYCGFKGQGTDFLSAAQRRFIRHFCEVISKSLDTIDNGEEIIDLDAVADAAIAGAETPSFYVAEMSQQYKFKCHGCGCFNDILGRFGYCSFCGERNDNAIFRSETVAEIRNVLNNGQGRPEAALRDAVSAFDSFVAQYAKQLAEHVPLSSARKKRLTSRRFHDFDEVRSTFLQYFDIDLCNGMADRDSQYLTRAFYRRHLYEHNGGEVDSRYLLESGDSSVKLKQLLRETQQDSNKVLDLLMRVAQNLHDGFHELIPYAKGSRHP